MRRSPGEQVAVVGATDASLRREEIVWGKTPNGTGEDMADSFALYFLTMF